MFEIMQGEEKQASGLSIVRSEPPVPPLEIRRMTRRTALRSQDVRDALRFAEQTFTRS
jgi:hypothetical protein